MCVNTRNFLPGNKILKNLYVLLGRNTNLSKNSCNGLVVLDCIQRNGIYTELLCIIRKKETIIKPIRDLEITLGNRRLNRIQTIEIASHIISMLCNLRNVLQLRRTKKGGEASFKVPYKNAERSARAIFIPYINIVQDWYHAIAINKAKNSVDICVVPRVPFALYRDAETFYFADGMNQLCEG